VGALIAQDLPKTIILVLLGTFVSLAFGIPLGLYQAVKRYTVGDYVLTGGELPAMVVAEAATRLLPGVLKKEDATDAESFTSNKLDYPQYTRPPVWRSKRVPEVLFSGDHKKIADWRDRQSWLATKRKRPDLLETNQRSRA